MTWLFQSAAFVRLPGKCVQAHWIEFSVQSQSSVDSARSVRRQSQKTAFVMRRNIAIPLTFEVTKRIIPTAYMYALMIWKVSVRCGQFPLRKNVYSNSWVNIVKTFLDWRLARSGEIIVDENNSERHTDPLYACPRLFVKFLVQTSGSSAHSYEMCQTTFLAVSAHNTANPSTSINVQFDTCTKSI